MSTFDKFYSKISLLKLKSSTERTDRRIREVKKAKGSEKPVGGSYEENQPEGVAVHRGSLKSQLGVGPGGTKGCRNGDSGSPLA